VQKFEETCYALDSVKGVECKHESPRNSVTPVMKLVRACTHTANNVLDILNSHFHG